MKRSLFWAAVEAAAKATRSGLSVVGALVDCGIPRQHAGEQWLTAFEEENECLEAPLSADFNDEPTIDRFGLKLTPESFERLGRSLDRITEAEQSAFRSGGRTWCTRCSQRIPQHPTGAGLCVCPPQDSRTNAGATCNRAVEETSEGASPPAAPSDVLEGDRFMTDAEFHAALAIEKRRWAGLAERLKASDGPVANPNIPTITDVLAEHYLETYSDRKIAGCRCGLEVGSRQQHWDHQADLISGALKARAQAAEK